MQRFNPPILKSARECILFILNNKISSKVHSRTGIFILDDTFIFNKLAYKATIKTSIFIDTETPAKLKDKTSNAHVWVTVSPNFIGKFLKIQPYKKEFKVTVSLLASLVKQSPKFKNFTNIYNS